MVALERPSAMNARTSSSRPVRSDRESRAPARFQELRDDFGEQGGASDGDPHERLHEVADVGDPILLQR